MPYNDPDPQDPMTLHGTAVETDNPEANREMAACFIEEYLRSGFGKAQLLSMFKIPDYIGPYMAFQALGEAAIVEIIEDCASLWGGRRDYDIAPRDADGRVAPPGSNLTYSDSSKEV